MVIGTAMTVWDIGFVFRTRGGSSPRQMISRGVTTIAVSAVRVRSVDGIGW